MAFRHLSRSIVLQTLFEWDFNTQKEEVVREALQRNIDEFAAGISEDDFIRKLFLGIVSKCQELDEIISKAAPDWPLDKISIIDRNVLRIGLYELLFSDRKEVPAKVAINESIELAKTFGGESSGKFINGVLGAVYKELGEPGKDEEGIKKKKAVPFDQMSIEKKVGGVVYSLEKDGPRLALVHDVFGHWTLSKGGLEENENESDGLKRVIGEEMGLEIDVEEKIGDNEYVANHPEKGRHRKQVSYYLCKAKNGFLKLGKKGGLDEARWFNLEETPELNFYEDIMPIITKSVEKIMILVSKK